MIIERIINYLFLNQKEIERQKIELSKQHTELEEIDKEITDSINYAKRIQSAILPPPTLFKTHLKSSFILYKPQDIVAGDFYWMETSTNSTTGQKTIYFATADRTGHGVDGAMVSVIYNGGLNRSMREFNYQILDKFSTKPEN